MKYFIAYRYTGEDADLVRANVKRVADALEAAGDEVYHNAFEGERYEKAHMSARQIMDEGFAELDNCDAVFVLITGNDRSEGQLMEVGYAYAKGRPIVVAVQKDVTTYVDSMADKVMRWTDLNELVKQIPEQLA